MKTTSILIVTCDGDVHADVVAALLQQRGYESLRLHPADIPMQILVQASIDEQQWASSLSINDEVIDLAALRAVWWRKPYPYQISPLLPKEERMYAEREVRHTLSGIWSNLDCYWMSFPTHITRASNKLEQLRRAARMGFHIPKTLVTNDPAKVREFYEACEGQVIYKSLEDPLLSDPTATYTIEPGARSSEKLRGVYSSPLTKEHLAHLEAVRLTPCCFQQLIPKRFELRVTVVEDELFVCEIHSQENERTRFDWRHYDVNIPYRAGSLPDELARRCLEMVRGYDLKFGAFDFILTPEGEYVFLELNPNGQWLFVQHFVPELKIAEKITDCLIRNAYK